MKKKAKVKAPAKDKMSMPKAVVVAEVKKKPAKAMPKGKC